jgi:putative glutathione S-transferase
MGQLVDGQWVTQPMRAAGADGRFKRPDTQFRNWITADGAPGPTGEGGFVAAPGRYHLYVSLACPWAHRTIIMRRLKGLQDMVGLSVVNWFMGEEGWTFEPGDGVVADPVNGARRIFQLYAKANPTYTGRASVPVLWDKERATIVSNESAEIIVMFNGAFDGVGARPGDYYPRALRGEIDALNDRVFNTVNNGVYKAGFARSQEAYEEAARELFETLDRLEDRLARTRYLFGGALTLADIRLFTTLVRFDLVYYSHFKCNVRRIADCPNLSGYLRELYQMPGIGGTVDLTHIKHHYYSSQESVNPSRIVPLGPQVDFTSPHGRQRLKAA